MKFRKLTIKNIRSYENQEIDFPEGSLLISGDVGSGKTTILLAIEYALFGLQPGQKGSALLRNNADLGEVMLELEIDDKEIIIERKIKRGSKSVTNDYASITIEGRKIESSITEVKTKILTLLGYPSEFIKKNNLLYRYTVYTPQEQMKQIILEDSETRLNVLRHVFGIDKYKRIRENLTIFLNRLKEESKILGLGVQNLEKEKDNIDRLKAFELNLKFKIELKDKELELFKKKSNDIESKSSELEEKGREKNKLESEIEKSKIMIGSKKETLISVNKEYLELSKRLSESKEVFSQESLTNTLNLIENKKKIIEEINTSHITTINNIHSLEQSKNDSLSRKDRVFNISFCPTCLQNVPDSHKHNIMNATETTIVEIKKSLESLSKKRDELKITLEKERKELIHLEDQKTNLIHLRSKLEFIETANNRLKDLAKNKDNFEKDILLLSKHLDGLKETILKYSRYDNLIRLNKEDLRKAFLEEKAVEISIAELNKEIEITRREIIRYEDLAKTKEESKKRLSELTELTDWLSNHFLNLVDFTERNVLIKLRKEFSKLFSKWFNLLAGESFDVQLDENFTPLIMQGDIEMDYSFLSGGERTAVALAYRLALNQTINSILSSIKTKDLIILDEPTDGFSEAQIDKIRDILYEINIKQLIIVSHEQKIEGFVDNVLKIRKENDLSSIIQNISPEAEYQKT